jgi:hypothetical protein
MKSISMMMIQTDGGRTSIDASAPLFRENGCIASFRRTVVVVGGTWHYQRWDSYF